jgi:hypothetical protein
LAWIGLQTLFMVLVGGERFPGHRFLVPLLPLLCVLSTAAPIALGSTRRRRFVLLVGAILAAGLALAPSVVLGLFEAVAQGLRLQRAPEEHAARLLAEARFLGLACLAASVTALLAFWSRRAATGLVAVWLVATWWIDPSVRVCRAPGPAAATGRVVGEWLRAAAPADVVVATNAAGALPYFSRLPVIDMLGLTDAHIARSHADRGQWIGHERGDGDYVLDRRPDIIIFGGPEGSQAPWSFPGDQQIATDPRFVRDYELQRVALPEFVFTYWRARQGRMPEKGLTVLP